jgi:hypothetical protein
MLDMLEDVKINCRTPPKVDGSSSLLDPLR